MLEDYMECMGWKGVNNHIKLKCAGEACFYEGDMGLE